MKIKARIDRVVPNGKVKAVASVSLDGKFVVKNLKIIDGRKGLFVSMPQESYQGQDGTTKYSNVFFALTNAARMDLQEAVLGAYQQHMDPQHKQQTRSNGQSAIPQEVQYQQEHYPNPPLPNPPLPYPPYPEQRYHEPQYPEPQYPDWVEDYDGGPVMDMGMGY